MANLRDGEHDDDFASALRGLSLFELRRLEALLDKDDQP